MLFFLSFVPILLVLLVAPLVLFLDEIVNEVVGMVGGVGVGVIGLTNFLATSAYENDVRLGVRVKGIGGEAEGDDTE